MATSDQRAITIAFSVNDYFVLIVGGVLFAAATVMREAGRLADETRVSCDRAANDRSLLIHAEHV
jgi:hypothetical protein